MAHHQVITTATAAEPSSYSGDIVRKLKFPGTFDDGFAGGHETATLQREYDSITVFKYGEVQNLIDKLIKHKDMLQANSKMVNENRKKDDIFREVINTHKHNLMNRCSLKLLNLNVALDDIIGQCITKNNNVRYADLCCAPGGFTYFLLSRYRDCVMNVFMTSMSSSSSSSYLPMDLEAVMSNNVKSNVCYLEGDITNEKFRNDFETFVEEKVDFVLADGGIDFTNIENFQEFYTRHLCLAEVVMGLKLLKEGGFIICKFFDMYSLFTASMLYVLGSVVFSEVTVCKPVTSKSANAERYVLFKGYKPNHNVTKKLNDILNEDMSLQKKGVEMINSVFKIGHDDNDDDFNEFYDSLLNVNKQLSNNQFVGLQEYLGKCSKSLLMEDSKNKKKTNGFVLYKTWMTV